MQISDFAFNSNRNSLKIKCQTVPTEENAFTYQSTSHTNLETNRNSARNPLTQKKIADLFGTQATDGHFQEGLITPRGNGFGMTDPDDLEVLLNQRPHSTTSNDRDNYLDGDLDQIENEDEQDNFDISPGANDLGYGQSSRSPSEQQNFMAQKLISDRLERMTPEFKLNGHELLEGQPKGLSTPPNDQEVHLTPFDYNNHRMQRHTVTPFLPELE